MGMRFCPICNSVMKDGICTNKKCGNSQFEIDFNKRINVIEKTCPKKYYNLLNKSIDLTIGTLTEALTYDKEKTIIFKSLNLIEKLIKNNIRTVKASGDMYGKEGFITHIVRYMNLKEVIGKVTKIKKHYIQYTFVSNVGDILSKPRFLGSNDFEKWENVGHYPISKDDLDTIEIVLGGGYSQCYNWTLGIIDKKTGIELKTFFTKEQAYELFKDREIKEGNKRRTALKHVVSEFERQKPKITTVEEYLRGDMAFEWRGLNFKVYPPLEVENRVFKIE